MLNPAKVKVMVRDGYSLRQIADHYSVPKSTVHRMARQAGVPSDLLDAPLLPQRMTPQVLRTEVPHLAKQGLHPAQIASSLGISRATVYRYLP